MDNARQIRVYSFTLFDERHKHPMVQPFQAPVDRIREWGGEAIQGTARLVSMDELDDLGHFRREASGWANLSRIVDDAPA